MSNKIKQINEKLRELKENHGFDLSDPNGIALGGKLYFAVDKRLSLDYQDDYSGSYHQAKIPFENSHIVELYVQQQQLSVDKGSKIPAIGANVSYPSNKGMHLSSADRRDFGYYHQGHDEDLHKKLEEWSKSDSKALHLPDNEYWEDFEGTVVTGPDAHEIRRNSPISFTVDKPHEIQVLFPDESYKYDLRTEQLKKFD